MAQAASQPEITCHTSPDFVAPCPTAYFKTFQALCRGRKQTITLSLNLLDDLYEVLAVD